MVLWLLRHPAPEAVVRGRCYGSLDVALSEGGMRQARAMTRMLSAEPLAAIYASPRKRCRQAAEMIAGGRARSVETMDAFRELDFGEFEGRTYEEIAASHPELYRQWMERPTEVQFPGGENFAAMRTRVLDGLRQVRTRHNGESVALVTHGGVARIMLADALGMQPADIFRIGQRYGAINAIQYYEDTCVVERMNAEALLRVFHAAEADCTRSVLGGRD